MTLTIVSSYLRRLALESVAYRDCDKRCWGEKEVKRAESSICVCPLTRRTNKYGAICQLIHTCSPC